MRRLAAPGTAGIHRVAWDLRYPDPERGPVGPWSRRAGPLAMPGTYTAELVRRDGDGAMRLGEPQSFTPKVLAAAGVPPVDAEARHAFQREVAALQRKVFGAVSALGASIERVEALAEAIDESGAEGDLRTQASAIRAGLLELRVRFLGDDTVRSRAEAVLPGIRQRIQRVVGAFWSTSDPTTTHRRQAEIVTEQFGPANSRSSSTSWRRSSRVSKPRRTPPECPGPRAGESPGNRTTPHARHRAQKHLTYGGAP